MLALLVPFQAGHEVQSHELHVLVDVCKFAANSSGVEELTIRNDVPAFWGE